jgi:hypothetical protein
MMRLISRVHNKTELEDIKGGNQKLSGVRIVPYSVGVPEFTSGFNTMVVISGARIVAYSVVVPEFTSGFIFYCWVRVSQCSLFVLFLLIIELSILLLFTASDYLL